MTISHVAYADSLNSSASDLFEDQGYVVVRGLLDDDQDVRPVRDEYDALLNSLAAQWREEGVVSSTYEDLPFERRLAEIAAEGAPYSRHFDISLSAGTGLMHRGPAVFNLLRSPRLLDGAELFIGPELYSNPVQHVRIKVPERIIPDDRRDALNSKSPWYQDMAVVQPEAEDTEMLTVWVAISDATEENGCLVVAPESHREGMALHCKSGGIHPRGGRGRQPAAPGDGVRRRAVHVQAHQARVARQRERRRSLQLRPAVQPRQPAHGAALVSRIRGPQQVQPGQRSARLRGVGPPLERGEDRPRSRGLQDARQPAPPDAGAGPPLRLDISRKAG